MVLCLLVTVMCCYAVMAYMFVNNTALNYTITFVGPVILIIMSHIIVFTDKN